MLNYVSMAVVSLATLAYAADASACGGGGSCSAGGAAVYAAQAPVTPTMSMAAKPAAAAPATASRTVRTYSYEPAAAPVYRPYSGGYRPSYGGGAKDAAWKIKAGW